MFKDCSIVFNEKPNGIYFCGELVTGFVHITLSEEKRITDLIFQSKGTSKCQWSKRRGRSTLTYSTTENHYRSSMSLLLDYDRDAEQNNTVLLEAGSHSFPFSMTLPEELPTTFESKNGYVRYTITVKSIRPLCVDETYTIAFTLISKCDITSIQHAHLPIQKDVRNSFTTCFISQGAVQMTVSLPETGFLPGQKIPITCSVNNYSTVPITEITYAFRRIATYIVDHGLAKKKKKDVVVYVGKGVGPQTELVHHVAFPVPAVPPSTHLEHHLVKIEYQLRVKGIVSFLHYDPKIDIPLIIGSVPSSSASDGEASTSGTGVSSHGNLPPPTYEECQGSMEDFSFVDFDNEGGSNPYLPKYPVYSFPELDPQFEDLKQKKT